MSETEFETHGNTTVMRMPASANQPIGGMHYGFGGARSIEEAEVRDLRNRLEMTQAAHDEGLLDRFPDGTQRGLMPASHTSMREPETRSSAEIRAELERALAQDNPFRMGG